MNTLGSTAAGASSTSRIAPQQPSLVTVQDNLNECHNIASDLENIANRLLGARPEKPGDSVGAPDGQVNYLVVAAESLRERLVSVHARLSEV